MKRLLIGTVLLGIFTLLVQSCSTNSGSDDATVADSLTILKETTGTTTEGSYSVAIKQQYSSATSVTQRACVYSLERTDGNKYGFCFIENMKPAGISYQVYLKIESSSTILSTDYDRISIVGNSATISLSGAVETTETDSEGNYEYYIIANITSSNITNLQNQTSATITLVGTKTLSFTIPYDWFFYLTTYF